MKWTIIIATVIVILVEVRRCLIRRKKCHCTSCGYYENGFCTNKKVKNVAEMGEVCKYFIDRQN